MHAFSAPIIDALRFAAAELHAPVWLVGGALRDALLGRESHDYDVAVEGSSEALARRVLQAYRSRHGGHSGVGCLDERTETYRVSTAGATLDIIRAPFTIERDLWRRDLTVNALALPLHARPTVSNLLDPTGGLRDLRDGVIRAVSQRALMDDPVRLMRVARFAVQLGFEVHGETRNWTRELAYLVAAAPGERTGEELLRTLAAEQARLAPGLLDDLRLLDPLLPELAALRGVGQGGYHHLDGYAHSLATCEALADLLAGRASEPGLPDEQLRGARDAIRTNPIPQVRDRRALLLLGALLHDIGKPSTRTEEPDGAVHFLGHPEAGADLLGAVGRRLRLSRSERTYLAALVRHHMRPCLLGATEEPTLRALGRMVRDLGDLTPDVCLLSLADRFAARGPATTVSMLDRQVSAVAGALSLWHERIAAGDPLQPLVTGADVMRALRIGEGPTVGKVLQEVRAGQLAGELLTREDAIAFAARRLAEGGFDAEI